MHSKLFTYPLLLVALLLCSLATAQETQKAKAAQKTAKSRGPNPAFAPIEDQPGLPRVLLIGDSISIGYTLAVRQELATVANVHRIPTNGGPTTNGLANINKWLGDNEWDVIHFNWGLHDLKYVDDQGQLVDVTEKSQTGVILR